MRNSLNTGIRRVYHVWHQLHKSGMSSSLHDHGKQTLTPTQSKLNILTSVVSSPTMSASTGTCSDTGARCVDFTLSHPCSPQNACNHIRASNSPDKSQLLTGAHFKGCAQTSHYLSTDPITALSEHCVSAGPPATCFIASEKFQQIQDENRGT